ncbi:MAG: DUF11 domain-containing protein, partial [Methanomicrobiales archaeon]|nr:DUF11 domain-containing protein [Methanomicrobiales archaeon]
PVIYGDTVVWQDARAGTGLEDIYMLNLSSMVESPVCTEVGSQVHPAVWKNIIVWEDYRNSNADIYMYDLSSQAERPVCVDPAGQTNPTVWGGRIIWEDRRNATINLYMCCLSYWEAGENLEWPVGLFLHDKFGKLANQQSPRIMGDNLVFVDDRSGTSDVYLYKFHNKLWGDLLQVTSTTIEEHAPSTYGNHVVWYTDTSANPYLESGCDIYMWTRPPGADLSIGMHDDPDPVRVGGFVTYTLNVFNHGPGPSASVTVVDSLPVGIMFVSAATTQGNWSVANKNITFTLGSLDSGGSALLSVTAQALEEKKVRNIAWVSGNATDNIPGNNWVSEYTTLQTFMSVTIDTGWSSSLVVDKVGDPHVSYVVSGGGGNLRIASNASG